MYILFLLYYFCPALIRSCISFQQSSVFFKVLFYLSFSLGELMYWRLPKIVGSLLFIKLNIWLYFWIKILFKLWIWPYTFFNCCVVVYISFLILFFISLICCFKVCNELTQIYCLLIFGSPFIVAHIISFSIDYWYPRLVCIWFITIGYIKLICSFHFVFEKLMNAY